MVRLICGVNILTSEQLQLLTSDLDPLTKTDGQFLLEIESIFHQNSPISIWFSRETFWAVKAWLVES